MAVAAVKSIHTLGCSAGVTTSVSPVKLTPEVSPVPDSENVRAPTVSVAVTGPGAVGRNVKLMSSLPPAGIVAGNVGRVPSVKRELFELMVVKLAGPVPGFTIWNWAELLP